MGMKVIVLQGVSGSGKSTYGRKLAKEAEAKGAFVRTVSADNFFVALGGGTYKFDPSKLGEAHALCLRTFINAMIERWDGYFTNDSLVIVDNTNTTAVEIAPYMASAAAFGWDAEVHYVKCDPTVAAARNLHGVPEKSVRAMASRIESESFPPWWKIVPVEG